MNTLAAVAALLVVGLLIMAVRAERLRVLSLRSERRREELEAIVDKATDAMLVIDIGNGAVLDANARTVELLGRTRGALLAESIFTLCPKERLHACAERVAEAWEKRGSLFDDVPLLHNDGSAIDVECSARVLPYRGRPAIFLQLRDVRERKRLQARVAEQNEELRRRNRDMLDSMACAGTIQRALVPDSSVWGSDAPEHAVLFEPRDIVSGDFHWFAARDGRLLAAAADCTGHGVPGALMSMIGATLLNTIVNERGITSPASILNELRSEVIKAMASGSYGVDAHGMDIGLIAYDPRNAQLTFSGAQLGCWIARTGNDGTDWIELNADRMPVGVHPRQGHPFTERTVQLRAGDAVYLFTDGVVDQFGGPASKRFGKARLRALLEGHDRLSMQDRCARVQGALREWRGDADGTDDRLLIGLRA